MDANRGSPGSAFEELARTTGHERPGADHAIHLLPRTPGLSDEAAVDAVLADPPPVAGLAPPGWPSDFLTPPDGPTLAELHEIDADCAHRALTYVLRHDLVFNDDGLVPAFRAEALAAAFVSTLRVPARWWTNTDGTHQIPPRWSGWTPLTKATFDTGIIGVDDRSVLIVWFMDED